MSADSSNEVLKKLKVVFRVDDCKALELEAGLKDACGYHQQVGPMYCDPLSITEYQDELRLAFHSLERAEKNLKFIGPKNCQTLDTIYRDANDGDTTLMLLPRPHNEEEEPAGIYVITQRLRKTLELALTNVATPGTGGRRKSAKKYIAGIEMLARWFSDVFPKSKVSASKTGKFYKYVEFWFIHSLGQEEPGDLRRHIQNTLKESGVRLTH